VRDQPWPPTQIGRGLRELGIGWIAAHSPQAKGRVERSFQTAQDRLVQGWRVAGATTLEQANRYLESEYLPEGEAKFTVKAACADDAHRSLGKHHDWAAILSEVEQRVIPNDYTFRHDHKILQILRGDVRPRMRGSSLRIEVRRNGDVAARFEDRYVQLKECQPAPKTSTAARQIVAESDAPKKSPPAKSKWRNGFFQRPAPSLEKAIKISNATS
jgi:hypothetical protein